MHSNITWEVCWGQCSWDKRRTW